MRTVHAVVGALALAVASPAVGATVSNHTALALGAIVGSYSPSLSLRNKIALALLFEDRTASIPHPALITVTATSVVCHAGDVDIATFGCDLAFGTKTVTLTGRHAHELFTSVMESGVPPDGAAGTIFEALHNLSCKIDPAAIAQKTGAGADCTFDPGPP